MPIELVCPIIIVAWALMLTLLERRFPYIPGYKVFRREFWNDLLVYTLAQSYVLALVIAFIIRMIDSGTGLSRLELVSDWPIGLQLLFFLVTHDLWQYWFHRLQHSNRVMWRTHEAAHAPLHVDWLSGSRSHALEILIAQSVEFAPIILLGAAPEVAVLKACSDSIWGMFNHSNIRVRMGVLLYVFNGPELHRWHHELGAPAGGCNFSTKFAVWDWIWGTAYYPAPGAVPVGRYGLKRSEEFPHGNYWKQFLYAFRRKSRERGKAADKENTAVEHMY